MLFRLLVTMYEVDTVDLICYTNCTHSGVCLEICDMVLDFTFVPVVLSSDTIQYQYRNHFEACIGL
jgi:hypothetical protein